MLHNTDLFNAIDETWPPRTLTKLEDWIIREGCGGGQRVSATSGSGDIVAAEKAMIALGQNKLFMVQDQQIALDAELASRGYVFKDPVDLFVGDAKVLADGFHPKLDAIFAKFPMPILAEIWAKGGIGSARLNVMERAVCDKAFIMGRIGDRAAAAAFIAASNGICMAHAVEVLTNKRRQGIAERMMRAAAWWGLQQGAETLCVLAAQANKNAQRLYRKMGMETVGQYHYRVKV
jgi:GNAT superfamily N-acetyltransferase